MPIPDPTRFLLHNVAETPPAEGGGVILQRVPEAVRAQLSQGSANRMRHGSMTEIRFVMRDGPVEVDLRALGDLAVGVQVFFGDFQATASILGVHAPQAIHVGKGVQTVTVPQGWFATVEPERLKPWAFDPRVVRVVLTAGEPCLHEVRGDIRPPTADELPALRLLTYGTSITERFTAGEGHNAWAPQVAWRLGADLVNLGSAGSCHCENAFADHIAGRDDWDVAVLPLSTNMNCFPLDEFEARVRYLVHGVAAAHPDRLVVGITLWPKVADLGSDHLAANAGGPPEAYRRILREVIAAAPGANVHCLEGPDLLPGYRGLINDLVHPGDYGHAQIASNLEVELRHLLAGMPGLPQPLD